MRGLIAPNPLNHACSFLTKVDLLKEKLASGVRFGKHVPSYGDHPNDTPSVISCEASSPPLSPRFD